MTSRLLSLPRKISLRLVTLFWVVTVVTIASRERVGAHRINNYREAVASFISERGSDLFAGLHSDDWKVRKRTAMAAAHLGDEASDAILELTPCLQDPDVQVRRAATRALASLTANRTPAHDSRIALRKK